MITDPIADMLTRLRNANLALHQYVEMPSSGMRREIARILEQEGYIEGFKVDKGEVHDTLVVTLKYGDLRAEARVQAGPAHLRTQGPPSQGAGRDGRRDPVNVERRRHRPPGPGGRRRRRGALLRVVIR
jgi:hypothetical protein